MPLMDYISILVGANALALVLLLYVYIRNYLKIKAKFTLGLVIFAILFLIQNLMGFYFLITMREYYATGLELPTFVLTLLQTVAFVILLIITWE